MADQWYFARDKQRLGPFSAAELKDFAAQGQLQPSDTVWKEGIARGVVADQVKHLFSAPPAEGPPPAASVPADASSGSLSPPPRPSSALPAKRAMLEPWLAAPAAPGAPEDEPEIIPDGLMLKEMEENETTDPAPPLKVAADPESTDGAGAPSHSQTPLARKKKGRAIGSKGATLLSQDGHVVQYRKKCLKCGHEDASKSTMAIRIGVTRVSFFCPKCRKAGPVEIHCVT
jgi:GYF domain 2